MAVVAGDIRATMTLDTSKFSAGVAQAQSELSTLEAGGNRITNAYASVESRLGKSAAAIAEDLQRAGASSQKLLDLAGRADHANEKLGLLADRTAAARAELAAAQASAKASADALALLEDSAAASAENLQWAREQLDALSKSGDTASGKLLAAQDAVDEFSAELEQLNREVERQRAANDKNQGALKRAGDRYASLSVQLGGAEDAASRANERFDALAQTLSGSGKGLSLAGLIDDISALGSSTLTGASRSLGTIAVNAAGIGSTTAAGAIAAEGLGDALAGLVSAIRPVHLLLGASAVAAGYGAYALYQYATGAKDAREALERLDGTANEWADTDANTRFEQSEGMAAFGLDGNSFSGAVQSARGWMEELLRVWNDGKTETQEIVQEMSGGFSAGTDAMRDSLFEIKATAASGGFAGDGFLAGLDSDVERLDEIDQAVEDILQRRAGGFFSDADIEALQRLYDEREAISIKYNLEPEGAGFDRIVQGAQAALSRGADPVQVWADSYAAATQGAAAYADELNAQYDAQYDALQLIEDAQERQQALGELQAWYNEQAAQGAQEYYGALAQALDLTGGNMLSDGGAYADTAAGLEKINALMAELSGTAGEKARNALLTELAAELEGLDETQVVELTSALTSMQAAAEQSGGELDESYAAVLANIQSIKQALASGEGTFGAELLGSLETMFGENLDGEVMQVYAALDFESLENSYRAWAEGAHADIIPTIDAAGIEADVSEIKIDGLTGTVTAVTADGKTLEIQDISLDPLTGRVTAVTADGENLTIDIAALNGLEGTISQLSEAANLSKPVIQLKAAIAEIEPPRYAQKSGSALSYDFNQGMAQLNDGADEKLLGFIPRTSDIEALLNYTDALERYRRTQEGADAATDPYDAALLQEQAAGVKMELDAAAQNLTNALSTAGDGGDGFQAMAESIANGLQLLSDGKLDAAQAQELMRMLSALATITADPQAASELHFALSQIAQGLGALEGTQFEGATVDTLGEKLSGALTNLAPQFEAAGASIPQGVAAGMRDASDVEGAAQGIGDSAYQGVADAVQMGSPARRMVPVGISIAQGVAEGMKDVSSISTSAALAAAAANGALGAAFGGVDASGAGRALATSAAGGLSGVEGEFGRAGDNAGGAFVSELRGHIGAAASAATAIGSAAYNALKARLSIHSPSRKMRELGAHTGEGYALGISDRITMAENSIRRLADASLRAAEGRTGGARNSTININMYGAALRSSDDARKLSRQIARSVAEANHGVS